MPKRARWKAPAGRMPWRPFLVLLITSFGFGQPSADNARAIASHIDALRNDQTAGHAIEELARIGAPAVPALVEALKARDGRVRIRCVWVLARIGRPAHPALPVLLTMAADVSTEVETIALASALHAIGPDAVEPLLELLKHNDARTRATASLALGDDSQFELAEVVTGPPFNAAPIKRKRKRIDRRAVKPLLDALADQVADVRAAAASSLGGIDPDWDETATVVTRLAAAVNDPSEVVGTSAMQALGRMGPAARAAVPALIEVFRHRAAKRAMASYWAAEALAGIGDAAIAAVPVLLDALKSKEAKDREEALVALSGMSAAVDGALPALLGALKDEDLRVRNRAVLALAASGPESVPAIMSALRDDDARARAAASQALGWIGPRAEAAVGALIAVLNDEEEGVTFSAVVALSQIGRPAVPALIGALGADNRRVRVGALDALGRIGAAAAAAIEPVARLRDDPDAEVRAFAGVAAAGLRPGEATTALVAALGGDQIIPETRLHSMALAVAQGMAQEGVGTSARPVIALLRELRRNDEDGIAPLYLSRALERIGPAAQPALVEALKDERLLKDIVGPLTKIGAPAVPALIDTLKGDDRDGRAGAAWALLRIAETQARPLVILPALPTLVAALDDPNPKVRDWSARAIGTLGVDGREAAPQLVRLLQDPDRSVRDSAGRSLVGIGAADKTAIAALAARLREPDFQGRLEAAKALAQLGPLAIPTLITELKDPDPRVRAAAACAVDYMERVPVSAALVAALTAALKDDHSRVRFRAARALKAVGPQAKPAIPALAESLADPDRRVREAAAAALGERVGRPALPILVAALKANDPVKRAQAAYAMCYLERAAEPASALLIEALGDEDATVRTAAAWALGRIHRGGDAVKRLAAGFAARSLRHGILPALLGIEADRRAASANHEAAIAALGRALEDPDAGVRRGAAQSLSFIGGDLSLAVPTLLAALGDTDDGVRTSAAEALARTGTRAVRALMESMNDHDERVRAGAVEALGKLSSLPFDLGPLIATLADPSPRVRTRAADALLGIAAYAPAERGAELQPAVARLRAALSDPTVAVRRASAAALELIGRRADPDGAAVPDLIRALRDDDAKVRRGAAAALRAYRRMARPAIPALREACRDRDEDVRLVAKNALDCILGD